MRRAAPKKLDAITLLAQAGAAKRRCGALSKRRTGSLFPSLFSMSCSAFSRASFHGMLKSSPMLPFFCLTSLSSSSRGGRKMGSARTLELGHGALLVMGGTCQRHYVHGVPRQTSVLGERISLTFRRLLRAPDADPTS